ncbi:uncharacterized protein EAE97_005935 [Botrytis byssoidea]|uniref:Cytochrome P450 n=1 Tax=Botrytis byssoidea TaxID=139641 RepID=A0A9P5INI0_9HELO|nr:uncharacterized protein EAE97_005935 [Botrytis byssoidea]KAF7943865.1 hypothetical protein EAE97_005935 [Botrytis byssoidea]
MPTFIAIQCNMSGRIIISSPHDKSRVFDSYLYQAYIVLFRSNRDTSFSLPFTQLQSMDTTKVSRSTYLVSSQILLPLQLIVIVVGFTSLCCAFQRLYLHPLSKIPGPRLAAATSWYEFYYNAIRDGIYTRSFEKMHTDYNSSVVRIAPNHVHVNDPEFYSKMFNNRTIYRKDPGFYKQISVSESILSILDPHEHRLRRQKVNSLFSIKAADSMAPDILTIAQKAANIMMKRGEEKRPIDMHRLCRSISSEVLFKILFDEPQDLLDSQEEHPDLLTSMDGFLNNFWIMKAFPAVGWLATNLPESLAQKAVPGFKSIRDKCGKWATMAVARQNSREIIKNDSSSNTVFDLLLAPTPEEPRSEFSIPDLVDEAFLFVFAGTDTTGSTIANALYYILSSASVSSNLLGELNSHGITSHETFDCNLVQRLPYLTAVVKESMRVHTMVPGTLPRIVPDGGVVVDGHFIPAGTSISQTNLSLHHNASIFPSPEKFDPERWYRDEKKVLEKHFAPFSKGSRSCLGMNLANKEIHIVVGLFISRFEMELYETDARSMEWADRANAVNKSTVKVLVKRDRWADN